MQLVAGQRGRGRSVVSPSSRCGLRRERHDNRERSAQLRSVRERVPSPCERDRDVRERHMRHDVQCRLRDMRDGMLREEPDGSKLRSVDVQRLLRERRL